MMRFWEYFRQSRVSNNSISYEQDSLLGAVLVLPRRDLQESANGHDGDSSITRHNHKHGNTDTNIESPADSGLDVSVDHNRDVFATESNSERAHKKSVASNNDDWVKNASYQGDPETCIDHKRHNGQHTYVGASLNETVAEGKTLQESHARCLIIIDSKYPNYKQTIDMMKGLGDILVLKSGDGAFSVIREQLKELRNVASIHIFTELVDGELELGGEKVVMDSLSVQQKLLIRSWRTYLSNQGVIYLYDEAFSRSAAGRNAIEILEDLTGATVVVPASDIGVSVQLAEDADSWLDRSEVVADLLSTLDAGCADQITAYRCGVPTALSVRFDTSQHNSPLVIASIQVNDGIVSLKETRSISFVQRPQTGPRIVIKGEPKYIQRALEKLIVLSTHSEGIFLRVMITDISGKSISDRVIVLSAEKDSISQRESHKVSFEAGNGYVIHYKETAKLWLNLPHGVRCEAGKLSELTFIHKSTGTQVVFLIDWASSTPERLSYSATLLGIRNGISGLELIPESKSDIETALSCPSGPVDYETNYPLIVDTSELYPPQLTEKEWCLVSSPSEYAHLGDHIEITIAFSEPLYVCGNPRLQLELESGTVYADYTGLQGILLDQKLIFQYTVGTNDKARDGIIIRGLTESSTFAVAGCDYHSRRGLALDSGLIPVRRCPKIKISPFFLQSIPYCLLGDHMYTVDELHDVIFRSQDRNLAFCPCVNTTELFQTVRRFNQLCIITRSWLDRMVINAIEIINMDSGGKAFYGLNDWNEPSYHELEVGHPDFCGFTIDTFALMAPISSDQALTFQHILHNLPSNVTACAQFAYSPDSRNGTSRKRPELYLPYERLNLWQKNDVIPQPENLRTIETDYSESSVVNEVHRVNIATTPNVIHPYYRSVQQYKSLVLPDNQE